MEEIIEEMKQEENQEVENKEELPLEEEKKEQPQDVDTLLPGPKPIEKFDSVTSYANIIEGKRLDFAGRYSKNRKWSYIMMAIVMAIAIGSVICLTQKNAALNIVGWVMISTAVIGMLVYYIVTKNRMPYATKEYIKTVSDTLNSYNYTHQDIKEPVCDPQEKVELADIIVDGVYQDLTNIASRNVVRARYKGKKISVSDLGLYTGAGKNTKSTFVGKYITMENTLHFKDYFILSIRNKEQPVDAPTKLDGLTLLTDEDDFAIYGPKDEDIKKLVGTKFIPALKKIQLDNVLLNLNVVIWAGHTAAYISYCDEIMTLPFQNVFDGKANDKFKDDLYTLLEVFETINK